MGQGGGARLWPACRFGGSFTPCPGTCRRATARNAPDSCVRETPGDSARPAKRRQPRPARAATGTLGRAAEQQGAVPVAWARPCGGVSSSRRRTASEAAPAPGWIICFRPVAGLLAPESLTRACRSPVPPTQRWQSRQTLLGRARSAFSSPDGTSAACGQFDAADPAGSDWPVVGPGRSGLFARPCRRSCGFHRAPGLHKGLLRMLSG